MNLVLGTGLAKVLRDAVELTDGQFLAAALGRKAPALGRSPLPRRPYPPNLAARRLLPKEV